MPNSPEKTWRRPALAVVACWALLAAALGLGVRRPSAVPEGMATFLPPEFESQAAQLQLRELFPDQYRPALAVIVFHRPGGLTPEDLSVRLRGLVGWLRNPTLPSALPPAEAAQLRDYLTKAPLRSSLTDPYLANRLTSADGQSTLLVVGMPDIFTGQATKQTVRAIRQHLQTIDLAGLQTEITGDAGFYSNYAAAAQQSVERSTWVAVVLVIIILLLVYRNPLAMLVPLATIGAAVFVAMRLLYLLAPLGFVSDSIIQMFVVVIVFGCGTDYCLFLIARYKEEAAAGSSAATPDGAATTAGALAAAMRRALAATASSIVASALTVIGGLSLMSLTVFRAFSKAGPSTAVALAVGCLAALTLAPALYLLIGRLIFWPRGKDRGAIGPSFTTNLWERVAAWVLGRPGRIAVLVFALLAAPGLYSFTVRPTHNIFDELSADWSSVRGYQILARDYSPGTMGPATLLVEANEPLDSPRGWAFLGCLADELGKSTMVAEVLSPMQPGGPGTPRYQSAEELPSVLVRPLVEHYFFSADRRAARLEILLRQEPYTDDSVAAARELQAVAQRFKDETPLVRQVQLAGPSSTIADIKDVSHRDFRVIFVAVLVAIYLILLVVLRRPVLGLFLVGGTLLSFFAALGLADLVFVRLLGATGLDWKVRFFLFVLLVAVGVDYNIFLGVRMRQEMARRPAEEGIRVALARTGGIISACGLIVAGTFASMIAGTLSLTIQLGFALAAGILIDTFMVRPLFVPAVALILERLRARLKRS